MEIRITDPAKDELKKLIAQGKYMKVDLRKSGCCGYAFTILPTTYRSEDTLYEVDGIEIGVGKEANQYLKKFAIDYRRRGFKKGFEVQPNM
ncbi:MAG: iron-sulfur cluster biosynthesis family protein [Anaerovoracaceae bacterium]